MLGKVLRIPSQKMGWTTVGGPAPEAKCVLLGVPHTSAWDFVISYLFYTQFDKTAHVMIKKEFFKWPVGAFLRKVGCIPVDRSSASAMLFSLINEMEKVDTFHLAIAPEGTRHAVKKWKTGYHMIAKKVGCPVYMGYFDWKTKCVSIGKRWNSRMMREQIPTGSRLSMKRCTCAARTLKGM